MKRFTMMIVIAMMTLGVYAQQKATKSSTPIYAGGSLIFESTSDETAIAIVPEVGYKLSNKWGIGAKFGYGKEGSGDSKYTVFSFKPYLRQNMYAIGQVGVFLDYHILYQNEGQKDNKTNTFGIGVAPGLSLNLNSRLSVVSTIGFLGYTSSKLDVEGAEAVNKFILRARSEDIQLGIFYNF